MRSILAACAALWLAACAAESPTSSPTSTAPQTAAASSDSEKEMLCSREYPIGSNIPITKCRTRAQVDAGRATATEELRRAQTGGPNAKIGDGR